LLQGDWPALSVGMLWRCGADVPVQGPKSVAGEKRGKRSAGGYVRRWHGIRALPNALHDAGLHLGRFSPGRRQCSPHRRRLCDRSILDWLRCRRVAAAALRAAKLDPVVLIRG